MHEFAEVSETVKKKIVPPPKLKSAVKARAEEIRVAVEQECIKTGLEAEVRLDGSVAKDTWIRDYADVDIFMRVSPQLSKTQLRDVCLPPARKALRPHKIVERYAEHPYIESTVELDERRELRVNVVPCYKVEKGNWLSATDRSPYHTEYIRQHLTEAQRDEVRLLKAFMRGIGSYGADIKTGGFSGMLCETLIVSRGEFQQVVRDFTQWRDDDFIDVENYYEGRREEAHRIFREPLIVVDPVDKGRNLAAAVRQDQLWNFVAASRQVNSRPTTALFTEPKVKPLTRTEYRRLVLARGSTILCLVLGKIDAVVDILWSQLYRTERAVFSLLENNDFQMVRSWAWSDEKSLNLILFELELGQLPDARHHIGPPVSKFNESASFLSKHSRSASTISGPWIDNARWVVQKKRRFVSAKTLLTSALRSGGEDVGVAGLLAKSFRKNMRILENENVGMLIASNTEFAKAMRTYLSGRPAWFA
ncbi:MAG: CCA tRNA nucleotidyltransferase [Candidatus Bathyarchaeia archaeon]